MPLPQLTASSLRVWSPSCGYRRVRSSARNVTPEPVRTVILGSADLGLKLAHPFVSPSTA